MINKKLKISKIISFMLVICIILFPTSIGANAAESLVKFESSETYTVTFPEYIEATPQSVSDIKYAVNATDVVIPSDTELNVSLNFNGSLIHREDDTVLLNYDMYAEQSVTQKKLTSNEVVLQVQAGNVSENTSQVFAKLTSDVLYAGMYKDTVTFSVGVNKVNNLADLQDKHVFEYYSTLVGAVNDANSGTIGENADVDRENATAGIYTDENGKVNVVLLKNSAESNRVTVSTSMIINLGGNTFTSDNPVAVEIMSGDVVIDGRILGSCIDATTDGNVTRTIQARTGSLTILGGKYVNNSVATNNAAVVMSAGNVIIDKALLKISNSGSGTTRGIWTPNKKELSVTNTDINVFAQGGSAYGIDTTSTSAEISNVNITCEGTGSNTVGIYNLQNAIISNSNIIAISPYHAVSGENDYAKASQGIFNRKNADMQIYNCNVKGNHSGVQNCGNLYVNGGVYMGFGHGGFYFSGEGTETQNIVTYVENATISECEWFGKYQHDDESNNGAYSNHSGFYMGGREDMNYISVYMNNCEIYGSKQPIVLRDSSGEHDLTLYISNSSINTDAKIRIDNETNRVFIGKGNNFNTENCKGVVSDNVIITNEVYVK